MMAVVLACLTSSCGLFLMGLGDGSGQQESKSRGQVRAEQKDNQWRELPYYIIPRMCAYYQLHPECFKPTGLGEEIEIEGFAAFVKEDDYFKSHRSSLRSGKIIDPWGEPVHFVQDLNMDGYIEVGGERKAVVATPVGGEVAITNREHHFGIFKQSPFKGPDGSPSERILDMTFYEYGTRKQ
jgi:hypothetical protein